MDATPAAAAESSGRRGSDEGGKGRSGGQRNRKAASSLAPLPSSVAFAAAEFVACDADLLVCTRFGSRS